VDRARRAKPLRNPGRTGPLAADFRQLVADHESQEMLYREEQRRAAAQQGCRQLVELIDHHISGENWRALMREAHQAAERGEKEFMLLRFPNQRCSDGVGGRGDSVSRNFANSEP